MEIKKFDHSNKKWMQAAFAIRNEVFVVEQEVDAREEYDEFETNSKHFLVMDEGKPVATARWRITENGIKLERFAVLKAHRGKGFGLTVLKAVLEDLPSEPKRIYLHAQVQVVDFYGKVGFKAVGDEFIEANIRHYIMELNRP